MNQSEDYVSQETLTNSKRIYTIHIPNVFEYMVKQTSHSKIENQEELRYERKMSRDYYDLQLAKKAVKRQNRSFERQSDNFCYFINGNSTQQIIANHKPSSNLTLYRQNFRKLQQQLYNNRQFQQSDSVSKENHVSNKGFTHIFQPELNPSSDDIFCLVCGQPFIKHQEHLITYSNNEIVRDKQQLKRVNSFCESQKFKLKQSNFENHSFQYRLVKANKNINKLNKKEFFCDICFQEDHIKNITFLQCGHFFCKNCLQDYLNYHINVSGEVHKIKCPQTSCTVKLELKAMQELLKTKQQQKLLRFLQNYEVSISTNKKFCPYPGCEQIIQVNSRQKETTCSKCQRKFCFQCQLPWHSGVTCQVASDQLYSEWAERVGAHKCPQCKSPIENTYGGCSHMQCSRCGCQWCWICGMPLNHWTHRMEDYNVISCKNQERVGKNRSLIIITFIIKLLLLPFIILIKSFLLAFNIGHQVILNISINKLNSYKTWWSYLLIILLIPFYTALLAISIVISIVLAAISTTVFTIPLMIVTIYLFYKSIKWWNQSKITTATQKNNNRQIIS